MREEAIDVLPGVSKIRIICICSLGRIYIENVKKQAGEKIIAIIPTIYMPKKLAESAETK
jgi:hypothetical protein